jgi:glyoxylase-like metal-dependent hydrolase (beta-lactamase superfamily II)
VDEILPGVFHWRAHHPKIRVLVDSWWLAEGGVLVDPLIPPEEGLDWFESAPGGPPEAIVLSNRHHFRQSDHFQRRFGCAVMVPRSGVHEFSGKQWVETYDPGDELPGDMVVHEIGSLCPDDMALHLPSAEAVFFADGVVLGGPHGQPGKLGFVPDSLMDDPPKTKDGLLESLRELLDEVEFRHVLLAHGGPVLGDGREQLEELVAIGGRTAFEM